MNKPVRIKFVARWGGPIEGHAVNTVRRLFPMLCAEHEFDDLMQEAYIVFMKCKAKGSRIDNPRWFMSYFSISLRNTLLKLAAKCGRIVLIEDLPAAALLEPAGDAEEAFEACLLRGLPEAVKEMIWQVCFGSGPAGRAAYRALREVLPSTI